MNQSHKGGVPIIVAIVVLLVGVAIGGYHIGTYRNVQNKQNYPQPTPTARANTALSNNILTNSTMHLQFFYPIEYKVVTDVDGMITVSKDQLGSDGISFVPKNHPNFIDIKNLELCPKTSKIELIEGADEPFCLQEDSKIETDIEISGVKLKSFLLSYPSLRRSFQIVQTVKDPIIQIWPSDPSASNTVFKQLVDGIHIY